MKASSHTSVHCKGFVDALNSDASLLSPFRSNSSASFFMPNRWHMVLQETTSVVPTVPTLVA
eukprot:CAMPEP_0185904592 /NCGR_PEP_ID=MMETSP0196C-20130402/3875_1 /TAXON_ID=2932 /ORGANISM="Alexandrium fundyense, Strain CCMP1719" /LENGTH=61 /DNA_ID=CAMNT_0028623931 /DNA_START=218 /DNA_END=399 /DNA_ORIENTATION=-